MMHKEMTDDERVLMIEEMIERGEVYHGYRDDEKVFYSKRNKKYECTREEFMSAYDPQLTWIAIAQKLGMSESTCINFGKKYLADQGYKKRLIFRKVLDEQIVVAFKGYPSKKLISIARELNMHPSSLIPRARKLGLMP
jgi:hypothetical protein